jgi:predicted alpha/beta hydrolase family esterase
LNTEVLLITLLAGTLGLAPVSAMAAKTWYVDDVTDPLEDGTAAHPYDSIQQAINAAANGDTVIVNHSSGCGRR